MALVLASRDDNGTPYYSGEPAGGWVMLPYHDPDSGRTVMMPADPQTGIFYRMSNAGYTPLVTVSGDSENGWRYDYVKADPAIISDPIALAILNAGYIPYEGLAYVYIHPQTGVIQISPNAPGALTIYGGFDRGRDPITGGRVIGDRNNSADIVKRAVDYRNSIYTGGDWLSNTVLSNGPMIVAAAVIAAIAAPALLASGAAPAVTSGTLTAAEAAELSALTASSAIDAAGIQAAVSSGYITSEVGAAAIQTLAAQEAGVSVQNIVDVVRQVPTSNPLDTSHVVDTVLSGNEPAIQANEAVKELQTLQQAAQAGQTVSQQAVAQAAQKGMTAADMLTKAGMSAVGTVVSTMIGKLTQGATGKTPAQLGVTRQPQPLPGSDNSGNLLPYGLGALALLLALH